MTRVARSKPPLTPRRVYADGLTAIVGDEVYYPHAGEWVEFKGRPSMGLYLAMAKLGESDAGVEKLRSLISAWSWTDDNGEPYASPPSAEDLMSLPAEEFRWLLQNAGAEADTDDDRKNDSTPST